MLWLWIMRVSTTKVALPARYWHWYQLQPVPDAGCPLRLYRMISVHVYLLQRTTCSRLESCWAGGPEPTGPCGSGLLHHPSGTRMQENALASHLSV